MLSADSATPAEPLAVASDPGLDQLLSEAITASAAAGPSATKSWPAVVEKPAIAKVSYNHAAMIDMILAQPTISQNELAARFGLTPSWVSQVMVSDAFQTALAKRREEIVDPLLRADIENNFKALVLRSQELLMEKLSKPASEIPDNLVIKALETSSRASGYGLKDSGGGPASPIDVHVHLNEMGQGLVALLRRRRAEAQALDAPFTEIAPTSAEG